MPFHQKDKYRAEILASKIFHQIELSVAIKQQLTFL